MVPNRNAPRYPSPGPRLRIGISTRLWRAWGWSVPILYAAGLLAGCNSVMPSLSSSPESGPPDPNCDAIRIFLAGEAVQSPDLLALKTKSEQLLNGAKKLNPERCSGKRTLERLYRLLDARLPSDAKWTAQHEVVERLQSKLMEKSDAFKWRLPGDKGTSSRATYLKRLAYQTDKHRRQSLFKLFNNARSRRWLEWGLRDLIRARAEEAKLAGFSHYAHFVLTRSGQNYAVVSQNAEAIRKRFAGPVQAWLRSTASALGIAAIDPWDLPLLLERAWGGGDGSASKNFPARAPGDFAKLFLAEAGIDFSAVAGTPDPADLHIKIDPPLVKTDFGGVVANFAIESYENEVRQQIPLFQRPTESARTAIGQSFFWLSLNSPNFGPDMQKVLGPPPVPLEESWLKPTGYLPLVLQIYAHACLFRFEELLYTQADDPADLWAENQRICWGIEASPFHGGFDEDSFLRRPFASGERALGGLAAVGIIDYAREKFGVGLSPDFGQALRKEWFPSGSEAGTLELLGRLTKRDLSTEALLKLLETTLPGS